VEHDLQFTDEAARRQEAGIGWTVQRTFTAVEQRDAPYVFFCSLHPGMSGRVYVNATGTVPTPTPSATAEPGDTTAPSDQSGSTTAPSTDSGATDTGTAPSTDSGGATAPAQEDSAANDTAPPAGSEAQQFEDFCAQNPGAC
jgi:hypothetical protein